MEFDEKYTESTFDIMDSLVGKKIVNVRLVDKAFFTTFVFELDNGETIYFETDDNDILLFTDVQYDHVYYRTDARGDIKNF